jgi:hypothetical protein
LWQTEAICLYSSISWSSVILLNYKFVSGNKVMCRAAQ